MKDILTFRDDLLVHLNEREDPADTTRLIDITEFIKDYLPTHFYQVCKDVNALFKHKEGEHGLITSDQDLGPYGFNQYYFKRIPVPPIKARITRNGKKYLEDKNPPPPIIKKIKNVDKRKIVNKGDGIQIVDSPDAKADNKIEKETKKKPPFGLPTLLYCLGAIVTIYLGYKSCDYANKPQATENNQPSKDTQNNGNQTPFK